MGARIQSATRSVLRGHVDKVWSLAFAPDGRRLASGGEDRTVLLWDLAGGCEERAYLGHRDGVNVVAFAPTGQALASGGEDGLVKVDALGPGPRWTGRGHRGGVNALAFSPDGRTLASGGGRYNHPGELILWTAGGREQTRLAGHGNEVMSLAFSPSGRFLASADFDGWVWLWDVAAGTATAAFPAHVGAVWKAAFYGDDHILATGGEDGHVRFWDAAGGQRLAELPGNTFGVLSFVFSHDGGRLAVGCFDGTVRLWALGDGPAVIGRHPGAVFTVAFGPDDRTLASAGMDRDIALWDLADPLRRPPAASRLWAEPDEANDGPLLVPAGDRADPFLLN